MSLNAPLLQGKTQVLSYLSEGKPDLDPWNAEAIIGAAEPLVKLNAALEESGDRSGYHPWVLVIDVHADQEGSDEANQKLTADRVAVIRQLLLSKNIDGLDMSYVQITPRGESQPLIAAPKDDREKMRNRRIEVKLERLPIPVEPSRGPVPRVP